MPEADLQERVREFAETLGWGYYHTQRSRYSPSGYPDTTLWRPPRLAYVECKRAGRVPTSVQRATLEQLSQCGPEVYVVWPGTVSPSCEPIPGVKLVTLDELGQLLA